MLKGKQRAYLKSLAVNLDTIFQIGKGGVTDEIIIQLSKALDARELIKVHILELFLHSVNIFLFLCNHILDKFRLGLYLY